MMHFWRASLFIFSRSYFVRALVEFILVETVLVEDPLYNSNSRLFLFAIGSYNLWIWKMYVFCMKLMFLYYISFYLFLGKKMKVYVPAMCLIYMSESFPAFQWISISFVVRGHSKASCMYYSGIDSWAT